MTKLSTYGGLKNRLKRTDKHRLFLDSGPEVALVQPIERNVITWLNFHRCSLGKLFWIVLLISQEKTYVGVIFNKL